MFSLQIEYSAWREFFLAGGVLASCWQLRREGAVAAEDWRKVLAHWDRDPPSGSIVFWLLPVPKGQSEAAGGRPKELSNACRRDLARRRGPNSADRT